MGAAGLPLLIILVRRLGRHEYHWRVYLALGLAAFCLSVSLDVEPVANLLSGYPTETALDNYLGQLVLGRLTGALFAAVSIFAGVLGVDVYRQLALAGVDSRPRRLLGRRRWR